MPLNIKQRNNANIVIEATTSAFESEPVELVSERDYTVISTTLDIGEQVDVFIYDYATDTFQPLKVGGDIVIMTKNYDVLTFSNVSCVLKFVKSATTVASGVSLVSR